MATILCCFGQVVPSYAHTMSPVLVTISESNTTDLHVVWSFSGDTSYVDPRGLSLSLSSHCTSDGTEVVAATESTWSREEYYRCVDLGGQALEVGVRGLEHVDTYVALRIVSLDQVERFYILDETSSSVSYSQNVGELDSLFQYLVVGGQHIFQGADHLLFVIALCLLARGALRPVIVLVTAFTVAHSITLSAAALGWVNLPTRPVEALIALSIALVAVDLFKNERFSTRRIIDYWPLVFVFGLLHGLGFAGSLMEIGLPRNALLATLLVFNLGVELAQLILVLVCVVLIRVAARLRLVDWLNPAVGIVIGCTSGYWLISRVV